MVEQGHVSKFQDIHHNSMISLWFLIVQESTDQHIASNMLPELDQAGTMYLVDD